MRPMYHLSEELLRPLNNYKDWVFSDRTQISLKSKVDFHVHPMFKENRGEFACSIDYLMGIDHEKHIGLPIDEQGTNLNYKYLRNYPKCVDPEFLEEIRQAGNTLDDELQSLLGAKSCALKMFYPPGGFIGWHTNWDVSGYNIVLTYTKNGGGYWRHIDPAQATSVVPKPDRLVHIDDVPGWHCKVGHFGKKSETDRLIWHCAYAKEPRLTVSYVIGDKGIWDNMVEELEGLNRA